MATSPTFNKVLRRMLTKEQQEKYSESIKFISNEMKKIMDMVVVEEEEDKSDYYVVYGEYHEKDGEVWTDEKFRYDTLEEAEADHSRMIKSKEYDIVYLDEMTWDEEAEEWDDNNIRI